VDTISAPVADQQASTPLEKFAAERGLRYGASAALAKAKVGSPANVSTATGSFSGLLMRSPSTYPSALLRAIAWFLIVNLFLSALTINAFVQGNETTKNVTLAIEAVLLVLLFFFALRRLVRTRSRKYAAEAFYRGYTADELRAEGPGISAKALDAYVTRLEEEITAPTQPA